MFSQLLISLNPIIIHIVQDLKNYFLKSRAESIDYRISSAFLFIIFHFAIAMSTACWINNTSFLMCVVLVFAFVEVCGCASGLDVISFYAFFPLRLMFYKIEEAVTIFVLRVYQHKNFLRFA